MKPAARPCSCRGCIVRSIIAALRRIYHGDTQIGHEIIWLLYLDLLLAPDDQPMCLGGRRAAQAMRRFVAQPELARPPLKARV